MLFDDNSLSIGGTPLVKLGRLAAGTKATVLAKIEGRNPPTRSSAALAPP